MAIFTVEAPKLYKGPTSYETGDIVIARVYNESLPRGSEKIAELGAYRYERARDGSVVQGGTYLGIVGFLGNELTFVPTEDETEAELRRRAAQNHALSRMSDDQTSFLLHYKQKITIPEFLLSRDGVRILLDQQGVEATCRIKLKL